MQKAILIAMFFVVAGRFLSGYTSVAFGPTLSWLGIIIGIVPTIAWAVEGIKKWSNAYSDGEDKTSDQ